MDFTPLPHQSPSTTSTESTTMDAVHSFSHQPDPIVTIRHPTIVSLSRNATTAVTSSQSNVYDLCIVGAGMFGSAAARHASSNVGVKICLVGPEEPTVSLLAIFFFVFVCEVIP